MEQATMIARCEGLWKESNDDPWQLCGVGPAKIGLDGSYCCEKCFKIVWECQRCGEVSPDLEWAPDLSASFCPPCLEEELAEEALDNPEQGDLRVWGNAFDDDPGEGDLSGWDKDPNDDDDGGVGKA